MQDTSPAERNRKVRYILILESKTIDLFRRGGLPGHHAGDGMRGLSAPFSNSCSSEHGSTFGRQRRFDSDLLSWRYHVRLLYKTRRRKDLV